MILVQLRPLTETFNSICYSATEMKNSIYYPFWMQGDGQHDTFSPPLLRVNIMDFYDQISIVLLSISCLCCNYLSKVILNENIQASVFYQAFSKMRFISTSKLSVWSCHFEVSKTFKICKLPYWTPSLYLRNCFNFVQNDNTTMYNPTQ